MDITLIPGIMKAKKWDVGARLMESWFNGIVAIKPAYSNTHQYVTMDWVLGFADAKNLYNEIFTNKIWSNAAAKVEVKKMLQRKQLLKPQCSFFNSLNKSAPELESESVNFRALKANGYYGYYGYSYQMYSDINDLTAALGRFVFKVAIGGTVEADTRIPSSYKVTVDEVGVFVKDSYDFEGDQFLGFWDADDNSVSVLNPLSGSAVGNDDFREWRTTNGRGGDFRVYSDVKRVKLDVPDSFTITA